MGKPSGVVRPDGRPARRFGDEIITPGEGYTEHTLGKIRALVADAQDDLRHDEADPEQECSALAETGAQIQSMEAPSQRKRRSLAPASEKMCDIAEPWPSPEPVASGFAENALGDAPARADSVFGYSAEWRKLHVIEGRMGRCVRLTLFSSHGVIPITVMAIILWPR